MRKPCIRSHTSKIDPKAVKELVQTLDVHPALRLWFTNASVHLGTSRRDAPFGICFPFTQNTFGTAVIGLPLGIETTARDVVDNVMR